MIKCGLNYISLGVLFVLEKCGLFIFNETLNEHMWLIQHRIIQLHYVNVVVNWQNKHELEFLMEMQL